MNRLSLLTLMATSAISLPAAGVFLPRVTIDRTGQEEDVSPVPASAPANSTDHGSARGT